MKHLLIAFMVSAALAGCASSTDEDESPLAPTGEQSVEKPIVQTGKLALDDLYMHGMRGSNNRLNDDDHTVGTATPPPPPPPPAN